MIIDGQTYTQAVEGARRMDTGNGIRFASPEHRDFYSGRAQALKPDVCLKALIYTLGLCDDTRRRLDSIYDVKGRTINPETIHAPWQTGSSLKACRLAFNLFNDGVPTVSYDGAPGIGDMNECKLYSASDIFCCSFAPYFFEAIRIRYPEYAAHLRRECGENG